MDLSVLTGTEPAQRDHARTSRGPALVSRADIVDRNGVVLASSLPTASLYADPAEVLDAEWRQRRSPTVFPRDRPGGAGEKAFASGGRFVWIKRNLSPEQQLAANRLGIPGFAFIREERRIYPLGQFDRACVGRDRCRRQRHCRIEGFFRCPPAPWRRTLALAIDVRVQSILRTELAAAMSEFKALGAAGCRRSTSAPARPWRWYRCLISILTTARTMTRRRPLQPRHQGRLRDGLDLQAVHGGDGAGYRHRQHVRRL